MRLWGALLGVVVALVLTAGSIRADEKSHRAAVKELFKVMDLPKTMQNTMDQTLEGQIKYNPPLKPYREVMRKFLSKYLSYESLEEELISLYAKEFTESEVKEMIAFYQTPVGKKVIKTLPTLMSRIAQVAGKRIEANQKEFQTMIEEAAKNK